MLHRSKESRSELRAPTGKQEKKRKRVVELTREMLGDILSLWSRTPVMNLLHLGKLMEKMQNQQAERLK